MALAVPRTFGAEAVLFGVAYLVVRMINLALYRITARHDPDVFRQLARFSATEVIGPVIKASSSLSRSVSRSSRSAWGPRLAHPRGRLGRHPRHPRHRHTPGGRTSTSWPSWRNGSCRRRAARRRPSSRDYCRYLHLPMIAGIVLFALGLERTIERVDEPFKAVPAVALCCGLSLYFLTHVVQRFRVDYFIRHNRGPAILCGSAASLTSAR